MSGSASIAGTSWWHDGLHWGAVVGTTFVGIIDNSVAPDAPGRTSDNNTQMLTGRRTGAVDSAIRTFTADGTIDQLLRTWIGPSAADAEKSIPLLRTSR